MCSFFAWQIANGMMGVWIICIYTAHDWKIKIFHLSVQAQPLGSLLNLGRNGNRMSFNLKMDPLQEIDSSVKNYVLMLKKLNVF